MKSTTVRTILCVMSLALGTGLAANAQNADYYIQLANENARRVQEARRIAQQEAAEAAAINAENVRPLEAARIQDQMDAAEARRLNNANRGIYRH